MTVRFDALTLSVMSNAVAMIAEEMGTVLERGSLSPNIRERRDASSAIFDARGRMIAQAAHIPVHLGAMPESVRAVMARKPAPGGRMVPTDVADHLVAIAGFPGDVSATIEMSTVTLRGTGIHASFFGSAGTLEADFGAKTLSVRSAGAEHAKPVAISEAEHDDWRAERDFVAAIRGEGSVELTDFETGRRYMQFVDAVHTSNREGQRIGLGDE